MAWQHLLAYITATVDQDLLLRKEFIRMHLDILVTRGLASEAPAAQDTEAMA